jgi:dTDP-4-amino-4,6-dideoxygalactose transaminase
VSIPFIDLRTQYERIQSGVEAAVLKVLRSGQYILGPEVGELESVLARHAGTRYCVSCASGTDALLMALMAHGVGPGDAVFAPTFTFFATAEVISLTGATPVFVDVDPVTFNMRPDQLEAAIRALAADDATIHPLPRRAPGTPPLRARGVISVDLFGLATDYDGLNTLANAHGLFLVEDAAQSYGARYQGRRAGSLAPIGCTSFFPAKPLGAYGDGGAVFTDDEATDELLRSIRVHGQGRDRYENVRIGINGRLDSIQAAVLLEKMRIFDDEIEARQRVADTYARLIASAGVDLIAPTVPEGHLSAWAQYSLLARDQAARDAMIAKLKAAGVPTAIYYPLPLHLQKAFAPLGYQAGDLPISESAAQRIFSIPMHPYLDEATQRQIVDAMK